MRTAIYLCGKYQIFDQNPSTVIKNKASLRNYHSPEEPEETWSLSVMQDPGWDPRRGKGQAGFSQALGSGLQHLSLVRLLPPAWGSAQGPDGGHGQPRMA